MAFRYCIEVRRACDASVQWGGRPAFKGEHLFALPGLTVASNEKAVVLPDECGLILGQIFSKAGCRRQYTLSKAITEQIVRTRGRNLIANFWGAYVAVIREGNGYVVIRDPSGQLPCYNWLAGGHSLYASDLDWLIEAGMPRPRVDLKALAAQLMSPDLKTSRTSLCGVGELLPGYCATTRTPGPDQAIWSPFDYCAPKAGTAAEAADNLAGVIDASVGALGEAYKVIGMSVSGGLDSSLVTAALRRQSHKLTLLNLVTDEGEGDERHYARLCAGSVNRELHEVFYRHEDIDLSHAASDYLPRPTYTALSKADIAVKQRMAATLGLTAWFSGLGGDNVFCYMKSTTATLDSLADRGLTGGFRTLRDIMRLTGCSLWQALGQLTSTYRRFKGRYQWAQDNSFVSAERINDLHGFFDHSWLDAPVGTPIGKTVHAAMLIRSQAAMDGFHRSGPPLINPLLSQPVVETCLSIPTWLWCSGGRDRAIARLAYAHVLPAALLNRRSKGGPNSFAYRAIESQMSTVRDRLQNGLLVEMKVLDAGALKNLFAGPKPADQYSRLATLLEAENWARHWS